MKRSFTKIATLTLVCSLFILGSLVAGAQVSNMQKPKGFVAFDHQALQNQQPKVEVNLNGNLIALAAKAAIKKMPPLAELINMIDGIYVRMYEYGYEHEEGKRDHTARLQNLFKHYEDKLKREKWELLAKVNEDDDECVQVMMLSNQEVIYGLFVSVLDNDELVMANVVGEINLELVGKFLEEVPLEKLMEGNFDFEDLMEHMGAHHEHREHGERRGHHEHGEDHDSDDR